MTAASGVIKCGLEDSKSPTPVWRKLRKQGSLILERLDRSFPGPPEREISFGFVPGRIEVFGRHTDYAGGRSLVCSIDRGFLFAAASNYGEMVRLQEDSPDFEPVEFRLSPSLSPRAGHWANYPMTMARRLARNFGASRGLTGVDIVFSSSMPVGSGMSGSSALMMMTFAAIESLNNFHEAPAFRRNIHDPIDLAVYLACAENGQDFRELAGDSGVGTFGGSEDHAAILSGRPGHLSLFGFCPASLQDEMPWPRGWRLVVAFSGVKAEKTREALEKYNMVSRRAREAVDCFNRLSGTRFTTLREVADRGTEKRASAWLDALDEMPGGSALRLADRVRQFILEDRTCIPGAVTALGKRDLEAFGKLLSCSHRASKKYLWNIVPEIDFLQRSAVHLGAVGASGFGAGFGGSIFAVVRSEQAKSFLAKWRDAYYRRYPRLVSTSDFFMTSPAPGIQLWGSEGPATLIDFLFQG